MLNKTGLWSKIIIWVWLKIKEPIEFKNSQFSWAGLSDHIDLQLDFIFIYTLRVKLKNSDLVLVESVLSPFFVCLVIWKNIVED